MSDRPDKAARVIEGETAYGAAPRRMRGMRASSGRRFQDSALACTDLVLKMEDRSPIIGLSHTAGRCNRRTIFVRAASFERGGWTALAVNRRFVSCRPSWRARQRRPMPSPGSVHPLSASSPSRSS